MAKKAERRNRGAVNRSQRSSPYKPRPPRADVESVWARIETLVGQEKSDSEPQTKEEKKRQRSQDRRRRRRARFVSILDVVGTVFWMTVLVKLFVADVDRMLMSWIAPQLIWLLDLRWLLVLVGAALVLILLRAKTLGISLAYVMTFPLIVVAWKLPKFFVKRRDTILITSLVGVAASLLGRAKSLFIAITVACIAAVLITTEGAPSAIIIAGMALMISTLSWSLWSTARDLLDATAFIRAQKKAVDWMISSDVIERVVSPEQPDRVELKTWSLDDAKKFRDAGGNALLARRVMLFWAGALDQYRRGPAVVVLNCLLICAMLAQTIVAFAFVNFGAFILMPTDFNFQRQPDAWTFLYYSSVGVYFGEISALSPSGGIALIAKLANGLVGSVGVLSIIVTTLIGHFVSRTNDATNGAAASLREKADRIEHLTEEQFQMSLEDLQGRLVLAQWGLFGVLDWIAAKTWVADDESPAVQPRA
ncbi:hypothetical protein QE418_000423 [Microbacterium testaceum]|uniref:hypothetical protein n=1 Tax=Microbacterium TaxID=33882 RepID=UPI00277EF34D|nr:MULTISPECIES: hypothetical protein [Microbacterium]MDQ1110975.1 hypothetical protein [Microbacterium testaceum]MDR6098484.1 hypothetical protein [Microbacterium sp. SORGH_AS_0454]